MTPGFEARHWYPEFDIDVAISQQGLRDRGYNLRRDDTVRIMALGDSFTFGFGVEVEQTYPKQLEQLLNDRGGGAEYEVINAGFPGYSTVQELRYFEEEGRHLEPDLVLIEFFPVNDFSDNLLDPDRYELLEGFLYTRGSVDTGPVDSWWTGAAKPWLWAHSHGYRYLADRLRRWVGGAVPASAEAKDATKPDPDVTTPVLGPLIT